MCGIAGLVIAGGRAHPPTTRELTRMIGVLRHRGPDGHGFYIDDHAALAHARLSIIDLSTGAQPLCNETGTVWVTFNGEIFNYVELREELRARGHTFRTKSDTEVIVHAYEEWGEGAWARFNGQFAFGLWDAPRRRLWLARDRVGIAPLYYATIPGGAANPGGVVFASEIKAILAGGRVPPALDAGGVATAFSLWSTPAPATAFRGVLAVRPGSSVRIDADLSISELVYWRPNFRPARDGTISAEAARGELKARLEEAVRLRFRADVPVAAYLSGGLDSSVITRIARRVHTGDLRTFSLRFRDPHFDEGSHQHRMAELLGTRHSEVVCGPEEIAAGLREVVWHAETPLLRTGPAPMFLLSRLVRSQGIKVVLTGEGSDELLAGYDIFKETKVRRFWARCPNSGARAALLGRIHRYVREARAGVMWQEFFRRTLADTSDPFYSHRPRWENTAWTLRFLSEPARAVASAALDAQIAASLDPSWRDAPALERAQAVELVSFMSSYLLTSQGDRVALGNSVEARFPFLDPGVIDFCSTLPSRLKLCGLRDKMILRELAAQDLPEEIWRRPKWPYRAPIAGALFGHAAPDFVRDALSDEGLARSNLIEAPAASRLVRRALGSDTTFSEREEMALVGLLTLRLCEEDLIRSLPARAEAAARALDNHPPDVLEDRRTRRSA